MKKLLLLLVVASSCTTRQIAKTPTRREIKKAMRYSTSDYIMPRYPSYNVSAASYKK
jgi:hypothetical protein